MCGIGIVGLETSLDRSRTLVSAMADRIRHRGPDAVRDLIQPRTRKQALTVAAAGPPLGIASAS